LPVAPVIPALAAVSEISPGAKRAGLPFALIGSIAALVVMGLAVMALMFTAVYRRNFKLRSLPSVSRAERSKSAASTSPISDTGSRTSSKTDGAALTQDNLNADSSPTPSANSDTPDAGVTASIAEKAAPSIARPVPPTEPRTGPKAVYASTRALQFYNAAIAKRRDGNAHAAVELFREAAEMGEPSAMEELGESYHIGDGVSKSDQEALRWFRRAAEAGNSGAMVSMGALYLLGDIVEASDEQAAQWFQKAADRQNPAGMFDLATLYENGQGVPRNVDRARQLYQRSAGLGNIEAQRRLAQLQKQK